MNINRQIKNLFFITISFFCTCVMVGDLLYVITGNIIQLTTFFIIGYIALFLRQVINGNLLSLYSFYLLTSSFFMYDKFLVGPYLGKGVMTINFAGSYTFPDWVGEKFVFIASISIIVIDIIYTVFRFKNSEMFSDKVDIDTVEEKRFYCKLGLIIMSIFIIPILYKIILQIKFQKSFANYAVANFTSQKDTTVYPWWTKGSGTFFTIGFLLFLYSFPSEKKARIGYFLYFLLMFTTAFKGGRAFFFTYLLSIPLLYKKIYNKSLSVFGMFLLGLILIAIGIILGNFRSNLITKVQKGIIANFLYGQTTTMGVPYVYLENNGNIPYKHYPFILTYLINPIRSFFVHANGGIIEKMKQSNNYGTIALYMLNPDLVQNGGGLGLNFLTEAYDCFGYIGVFFWSTLLGLIIKFVDTIKYSNKNRRLIVTVFFVYQYTLFLPRHSFFGITDHLKYIIMFYIVYYIITKWKTLFNTQDKIRGLD